MENRENMIIVSACLAGIRCRYDGKDNLCPQVRELVEDGKAIPLCPEQLGGLPTPRVPAEITDEKVINMNGIDVTENFRKGARETLKVAKLVNCRIAILKSNSPSCGFGKIYDGTFSNKLTEGNGFTSSLLAQNGIKIFSENTLPEFSAHRFSRIKTDKKNKKKSKSGRIST